MQGNFEARKREPATMVECQELVVKCREAFYAKVDGFVEPHFGMVDPDDLNGSRRFLENVLESWRR